MLVSAACRGLLIGRNAGGIRIAACNSLFADWGAKKCSPPGLRGPQPSPRGGPQLTFRSKASSAGCCPYDLLSRIVTMFYAVRRRRQECEVVRRGGAAANCAAQRAAGVVMGKFSGRGLRWSASELSRTTAGLRWREAAARTVLKNRNNSRAAAYPAAEAISEKGWPRRRSVKNRRPFDYFKSAEGIRFSAGARPTPKSFHRGGFWCYLLSTQKVTYEKNASCHRAFRRGLASQTGGCRKRFHSFFVLTNKKCGMTRGGVFGLLSAAAEDNAASRRNCSGSSLRWSAR